MSVSVRKRIGRTTRRDRPGTPAPVGAGFPGPGRGTFENLPGSRDEDGQIQTAFKSGNWKI